MNSYLIKESPQTIGCLTTTLIATALFACTQMPPAKKAEVIKLSGEMYHSLSVPSTFDQYRNIYSGEFMSETDQLVGEISNLYGRLLAKQERLESEFEAVLNENLWELYES